MIKSKEIIRNNKTFLLIEKIKRVPKRVAIRRKNWKPFGEALKKNVVTTTICKENSII